MNARCWRGTPYLLIGFGRWGSADPWLGIPVTWSQISGARAIVEATLPQMSPELSQGSHFFHNLSEPGHPLLHRVRPRGHRLELAGAAAGGRGTDFVRHVEAPQPLRVLVDGRTGQGVIAR